MRRADLDGNPLDQFRTWFADAGDAQREPEAMALATSSTDGRPSVRMVLLKGLDERGLVWFTNYGSRKGRELAGNSRAALLFYWSPLGRQVRVEGVVERLDPPESDAYFSTRGRGSRIGAHASRQSEPIEDRAALEACVAAMEARFPDEVPRPEQWGGFRLEPETWEFWQHRDDRLHDRFRYRRESGGWLVERLMP